MAVNKLSSSGSISSNKNSRVWDAIASTSGLVPLVWTSLSTSQTTIDITSIPQGYTNLKVIMCLRNTDSNYYTNNTVTFNNNTSTVYTRWAFAGTGTGMQWTGGYGQTGNPFFYSRGASNTSNIFGVNILDILNYSSTSVTKSMLHEYFDNTKSRSASTYYDKGFLQRNIAHFDSSSAIDRITISGNFAANSTVGIYGWKKFGA